MSPTFADLGVPEPIVDALAQRGITEPFEIQRAAIPDAMAGRDICGRAPTGSGKTMAFGIPIVSKVKKAEPKRPQALILAPTRELAGQITSELIPLAQPRKRFVEAVYGGVNIDRHIKSLRRGVDILVATPGRLEDLISRNAVSLEEVRYVVLDEADRMADMGFLPPVMRLLDQCHSKRQTLLFSATLDGDIAKLTAKYQKNPVRHEIGSAEPDITRMEHLFWNVTREDRLEVTARAVTNMGPTIVFVRTKHGADRVARKLNNDGVTAVAIHGNRSQNQRERALRSFDRGESSALVATDVAARGVHVDGVACVIHFDPPGDHKDYVHRSGRTARAGAQGVVISLLQRNQHRDAKKMQRQLGLEVPVTNPGDHDLASRPRPARPKRKASGKTDRNTDRNQSGRKKRSAEPHSSRSGSGPKRAQRSAEPKRRERPARSADPSRSNGSGERRSRYSEDELAQGRYAQRLAESNSTPEYGGSNTTPSGRKKKRKRDAADRKNHGAPKRLKQGQSDSAEGATPSGKSSKSTGSAKSRQPGKARAKPARKKPGAKKANAKKAAAQKSSAKPKRGPRKPQNAGRKKKRR